MTIREIPDLLSEHERTTDRVKVIGVEMGGFGAESRSIRALKSQMERPGSAAEVAARTVEFVLL